MSIRHDGESIRAFEPPAAARPPLYLCSGLQSSGTTLLSWCFLQRSDMHGVLDGGNDLLPELRPSAQVKKIWLKTTFGAFRLTELMGYYTDLGWVPRPLLVVRDVRLVWASLIRKRYCHHSITAEDPPLRLRFRRFREDWERFRNAGLPIVRYEDFISAPEATLRKTCQAVELPWDEDMTLWRRLSEPSSTHRQGNDTFWELRDRSLVLSIARHSESDWLGSIHEHDCDWLEREFAEFNQVNEYPSRMEAIRSNAEWLDMGTPRFTAGRRYRWELKRNPWRRWLSWFGWSGSRHLTAPPMD